LETKYKFSPQGNPSADESGIPALWHHGNPSVPTGTEHGRGLIGAPRPDNDRWRSLEAASPVNSVPRCDFVVFKNVAPSNDFS
jgi:hypothetical protein